MYGQPVTINVGQFIFRFIDHYESNCILYVRFFGAEIMLDNTIFYFNFLFLTSLLLSSLLSVLLGWNSP